MNICVVGSGYVGLVTGACLADFGMTVVGVDKDAAQGRRTASSGEIPIYEPGLETLVEKNMARGPAHASPPTSAPAIEEAQAVFIAVGTPPQPDGSADLTVRPRGRRVDRRPPERLQGHRHQEHGADRHRPDDRADRARARRGDQHEFAVVSQPRVPARGLGDRGLHAPRPGRHRHARPNARSS